MYQDLHVAQIGMPVAPEDDVVAGAQDTNQGLAATLPRPRPRAGESAHIHQVRDHMTSLICERTSTIGGAVDSAGLRGNAACRDGDSSPTRSNTGPEPPSCTTASWKSRGSGGRQR